MDKWFVGKVGVKPLVFATQVEAEAAIAGIELVDPKGVKRGEYYIDAPKSKVMG